MSGWFLLELGCAECGDMPLALPRGMYASEDEAQAAAGPNRGRWIAHPDGGSFTQWGSGGYWCAPIEALSKTGTDFGSEYDEEFRP